jgi:hypothetical protein
MGDIGGDKEKILKNCQNEPTSKTNSDFFLKFQVDSAPMVRRKIARTPWTMDFCPVKSKTLFSPRQKSADICPRHPQTADNRPASLLFT